MESIKAKGFSLVEMSVVLVIIGLILGSVVLFSGVQRSAEYTSIYSRYVQGWNDVYIEFFNRSGFVVGDGIPATGRVNGNTTSLCDTDMKTVFTNAGIELPTGRARGAEQLYVYTDSESSLQQLEVCFAHVTTWETSSGQQPANVMVIKGATVDLAMKIDSLIDVNSDAAWGDVRNLSNFDSTTSVAWPTLTDSGGDANIVTIYYRMPF